MVLAFLTGPRATTNPKYIPESWNVNLGKFSGNFSKRSGEVWALDKKARWKEALEKGDVVVSPAEGVYGYCCDPFNERAVRKVLSLKNRTAAKGLVVLVKDQRQMKRLLPEFTEYADDIERAMKAHWPGAVTLIVPARSTLPDHLTGGRGTIAVRMPAAPYMQEYLRMWGKPLVSTSCNLTGEPPARRFKDVPYGSVALPFTRDLPGTSSRIYDVMTGEWLR